MSDKFSYFDFLMYLLPGACLSLEIIASIFIVWHNELKDINIFANNEIFASMSFLIVSFIMGNFAQTVSHTTPEWILKKIFWGGRQPSEISLFGGDNPCFNDKELTKIKAKLIKIGMIDSEDFLAIDNTNIQKRIWSLKTNISKSDTEKAIKATQFCFNKIRKSKEIDDNTREKLNGGEAYYQFYRGTSTSFIIGFFIFMADAVFLEISDCYDKGVSFSFAMSAFMLLFSLVFFWRTRGTAQGWVKQVFYACLSFSEPAPQEQPQPKIITT